MKRIIVLLLALAASGCSYRVVVVSDCDAGLVEGDAAALEDGGEDAGPPPPCESECAYETGTENLYFVDRELNEHGVCKETLNLCASGVCDHETGCGPE